MAARAHMSPRHFARAFRAETGITPARYVERVRLEAARRRVEESAEPIAAVAQACGFGTAETMRRVFLRALGVGPAEYRRRFQSRAVPRARRMNIAILLYEQFTALDAIGPYEVLSRLPDARLTFVAEQAGPVRTDNGMLTLLAERSIDEEPAPDIVLVPGGPGEVAARAGGPALEWLRAAHETSTWTTSVCTGSLILAAAGLLEGRRATSHWLALEKLRRDGRRAGVRAGRVRRKDRDRRRACRRASTWR